MHIDRIYIQDNFVPDIVTDQFRRKVIGVSVCLKEGDGTAEAEAFGEAYLKEYIQKNTVNPHVSGISEVADNNSVPEVQIQKEVPKTTVEQIQSCTEMNVLLSYRLIAKTKPEYQEAYDLKFTELSNN